MSKGIASVIPKGYNTRSMLAAKIDRTLKIVKKMERNGSIEPDRKEQYGKLTVSLYHDRQIPAIKQLVAQNRPGRPRTTVVSGSQ